MNAFLTVRETLDLAAQFQLPPTVTPEARARLVTAVISELGLTKVGPGGGSRGVGALFGEAGGGGW